MWGASQVRTGSGIAAPSFRGSEAPQLTPAALSRMTL
jgi:hypothetical protein